MRVCKHGEEGPDHAVTYYTASSTRRPRTSPGWRWSPIPADHTMRVHALHIGHPIIGDPKYFIDDHNWDFPGGIQKRLHLHARISTCASERRSPQGDGAFVAAHGAKLEPAGLRPGGWRQGCRMKLVLFDCDGTLVDSAGLIHEVMRHTFPAFGKPEPAIETPSRSLA